MKHSHDLLTPISEEDVHYILEDDFDTQCHKATYDILCKNCGKKCHMTPHPNLFVSKKGDIIIEGTCADCQKPLNSIIKTSRRIDWKEYAMVVRDSRGFHAFWQPKHKSDNFKNIPTASKFNANFPKENDQQLEEQSS